MATVLNDNRGYTSNFVRAKLETYWGYNDDTLPSLQDNAKILKQVEKGREDVEKCKSFETKIWKKLRDKHGVTGSNHQENKHNKRRKMAVDDEAPKIVLLPSAFTAMVSLACTNMQRMVKSNKLQRSRCKY
jgi:hypothetical protein